MHSAIKKLFKVLAIPNSSTVNLRSLQTVLLQSALPINRTMSLSTSSSFHKIHESPFSHKAMYGSDQPLGNNPLKKPKGRSSVVKIKKNCEKKLKRRKKSVSGKSVSVSNSRNSSVSSIRSSLVSSTHSSSISTLPSVISTHSYPLSHQSTLPKIDSDSPKSIRACSENQSSLHGLKLPSKHSLVTPKHSLVTTSSAKSFNETDNFFLKLNPPSSSISSQSPISTPSTISLRLSRTHSAVSVHNDITRNPLGFRRGFTSRQNGDQFTVQDLACGLKRLQYKKIVVMSGAGISTTSGIPDFRTPGTGLYDNLQQYHIPEPSAIFDITFFVRNPKPFFMLAKELYPGKYSPNIVHYFVRLLQEKGLLLRNYTQNIDGLERLAGIKPGRLVESHGSFATASCTVCHSKHDSEEVKALIFKNKIPQCRHKFCTGMVKPDVVFFGEDLPHRFYSLRHTDLAQCDLLLIMGTSLEVEPFASLSTLTRYNILRILLNRELVGPFKYQRKRVTDIALIGDLVEQVSEVVRLAGWTDDLKKLMQEDQQRDGVGNCDESGQISFSVSKTVNDVNGEMSPKETGNKTGNISSVPVTNIESCDKIESVFQNNSRTGFIVPVRQGSLMTHNNESERHTKTTPTSPTVLNSYFRSVLPSSIIEKKDSKFSSSTQSSDEELSTQSSEEVSAGISKLTLDDK